MKEFFDNHEPIEIKLKNNNGEERIVKTQFCSAADYAKVEALQDDEEMPISKRTAAMMVILCGEDEEYWLTFSLITLTEIAKYITKEQSKKKQTRG